MKVKTVIIFIVFFSKALQSNAQSKWFSLYSDSTTLVKDANKIVQQLADRVIKIQPKIDLHQNIAIKNTTPYLIYIDFDKHTVNLPFWTEVIKEQQNFFAEVAGGEKEGKEVFGLFFNGFYVSHELGHSFFSKSGKRHDNSYDSEYDANTFAILYWKQTKQKNRLKKCYQYAKKMLKSLKNPVPSNEDYKTFMTKHYDEISSDPYKYGYIQFSQFVEIYENKELSNFDTYIKKI